MTTDNRSTLTVKLHIHKPPTSSAQGASVIQCNKKNVVWNSQLPLASIRSHAVTAGQSATNAGSMNSSFVWVGVRKSNGGRTCVSESDLTFFLYSALSFCFPGPGFRTLPHPQQKLECPFAPIKISLAQPLCSYLFTLYLSEEDACQYPPFMPWSIPPCNTKVLEDPTSTNLPLNSNLFLSTAQIRQTALYNWGDVHARPLWIMNLSLQGGLN